MRGNTELGIARSNSKPAATCLLFVQGDAELAPVCCGPSKLRWMHL